MQINQEHPDYTATKAERRMMRDCIAGDKAIKSYDIRKTYLPGFKDDPLDERYNKYITRAIFTGYTGRALKKTVGAIFRKESTVELPAKMKYLLEDATGCGQSLEQFAKEVVTEVNSVSRVGVLTDYPQKGEDINDQEQVAAGDLKARFKIYTDENIYNYRSVFVNGKEILTQVRLIEYFEKIMDEFTSTIEKRYRILDLFDGEQTGRGYYRQRLFGEDGSQIGEDIFPRNSKNQPWKEIPFVFIGADDNTSKRDSFPFYDLAVLNLGHYRNSADYEEGLHIRGQGTFVLNIGDMTGDQFKEQNGSEINIGARRAIVVGSGGGGELLQMAEGTGGIEAMDRKQDQMETFGVNIFSQAGKQQTAEEARIRAGAESSVLSIVVGNCSEGIEQSIEFACEFMGANPEEVEFSLNREFFPDTVTPQEATMLQMLRDDGDIATEDVRRLLRKGAVIDPSRTDEEIDRDSVKKEPKIELKPEGKTDVSI